MAKNTSKKTAAKTKNPGEESIKAKEKQTANAKHEGSTSSPELLSKKAKTAASKKSKSAKKQNDAALDDTLLTEEVEATEEIPDLADFEEDSAEETETDDSAEDGAESVVGLDGSMQSQSPPEDEEIILTDAEGRRLCRVRDCDQAALVESYCRFHYLQNWKRIQVRRKILADGKLERYVEELTSRYPDKFLEMIRKDLRTEKDFLTSIAELEIDESAVDNDFEDESQNFIDEVRGVTETSISDEEEF